MQKQLRLNRRTFLSRLSKAGIIGALGGAAPVIARAGTDLIPGDSAPAPAGHPPAGNVPGPEEHVFLSQPYLQCPAPGAITVRWITNRPCYSWVAYGTDGQLDKKAHIVHNGLVAANNRVHSVPLSGLEPGKTYQYKVIARDITGFEPYKLTYGNTIESDVYTFSTPASNARSVSWLILNDIHDRPASFAHLLGLNGQDPYDFVFLNGDMFDYQTGEQQLLDHLITPCTSVFASRTPFMFVRGNHETRGHFARQIHQYFDNPGEGHYFSFTWGPVHAIVLDTGEDKEDDAPVYAGIVDFDAYRRQQAEWLEQQMKTPAFRKAPFRVVMMHIPHYHAGDWHGTTHCRELFGPLFNKYGIDLFIAGHTHRYGVFDPIKGQHDHPIIIGGGPKEGQRTLIKVKADSKELQLAMLRDDGVEVGSYKIRSKR